MTHPLNVGSAIPLVVLRCVQFLEKPDVVKTDGIFRLSASVEDVYLLKHQWDTGHDVPFVGDFCHEATNLLKLYIRELPEPLCTKDLLPAWNSVFNSPSPEDQLKDTIAKLPATNRSILRSITGMLKKVSECSEHNRMNAENLARVWAPNIFGDGDLKVGFMLMAVLITNSEKYFN
uniref:Rho-GAP domain-containing protein n=1 Tax=Arcella intermedia TaxID=1963864 RepID=A0A6B2LLC0_9EUKA